MDEFGTSERVQVCDSPQYCRGKRQVVIHEATNDCAMERIIAQCPGNGASDRTPANNKDLARFCVAAAPLPHKSPQAARQHQPSQATRYDPNPNHTKPSA